MAPVYKLPTLSEDGWVDSPTKTMDYLFANFFATDYSQSNTFMGEVVSFSKILTDTQGDIQSTISTTRQTLTRYFSRYYNNVVVEVGEVPNLENSSKQQISIYATCTSDAGEIINLGMVAKYSGKILEEVYKYLNT